jgi:hypothetical protein
VPSRDQTSVVFRSDGSSTRDAVSPPASGRATSRVSVPKITS